MSEMNDAELRSLERLCSKDDLSDSNVASLTVLGLAAVREIRQWRAIAERDHGKPIGLTAKDRESLRWAREWIDLHPPSATTSQPKMKLALTILARLTEAGE